MDIPPHDPKQPVECCDTGSQQIYAIASIEMELAAKHFLEIVQATRCTEQEFYHAFQFLLEDNSTSVVLLETHRRLSIVI